MKTATVKPGFSKFHEYRAERKKEYLTEMQKVLPDLIDRKLSIYGIREWLSDHDYKTVTGKELTPMAVWNLLNELELKTYFSCSTDESMTKE